MALDIGAMVNGPTGQADCPSYRCWPKQYSLSPILTAVKYERQDFFARLLALVGDLDRSRRQRLGASTYRSLLAAKTFLCIAGDLET